MPTTLDACLRLTARRFGNRGILHVYEHNTFFQTYAGLLAAAEGFAAVLKECGCRQGDMVILSIERSDFFLTAFWGCVLAGVVPAPMPPLHNIKQETVEMQRLQAACALLKAPLICDSAHHHAYAFLKQLAGSKSLPLFNVEDMLKESEIREHRLAGTTAIVPDTLAVIQFSSGSTGEPKGICLTHKNIITNVCGILERVKATDSDKMVYWMPYYHDFGLFGSHIRSLVAGIDQVRIDPRHFIRNPLIWLKCIDTYKANITSSTNTGLELLVKRMQSATETFDLRHLKQIYLGAEIIAAGTCEAFNQALAPHGLRPTALSPGYGLAEATLVVTTAPVEEPVLVRKVNRQALAVENKVVYMPHAAGDGITCISVGKPIADFTVNIYDAHGKILPPNTAGEIGITGNSVTSGYIYNMAATTAVICNGTLYTGDMGFIDEAGDLYITGRKKELIIKNGVNYFPADIEDLLHRRMGRELKQVIACGYPDLRIGKDQLAIFFVPASAKTGLNELAREIRSVVNKTIGFPPDVVTPLRSNQVPRTSSAKIMRSRLVADLQEGMFNNTITMIDAMKEIKQSITKEELEPLVREAWQEALELPADFRLNNEAHFFANGGDSIRSVKVIALLEQRLGFKLDINFLYQYSTIKEQVRFLQEIDSRVEPPQDELELIIRDVVAGNLHINKHRLSMTARILEFAATLEDAHKITNAIREVFGITGDAQELLKQPSLRDIAIHIKNNYWHAYTSGNNKHHFALMNFQETLYYHSKSFLKNEPTGLSCYIIYRMPVTGDFDVTLFNKAFDHLVATHPMLRAVINEEGDMPFFHVLETVPPFNTQVIDLSHLTAAEQQEYLSDNDRADHQHRFDLTKYPLFYAKAIKLAPGKYELVIHIDHQLIDGYSFVEFVKELFECYDKLYEGLTPQTAALPVHFGDYVAIEKLRSRTQDYKKALDFALNVFRDIPPKITLPLINDPAHIQKVEFDTIHTTVEEPVMNAIIQIAGSHADISLNSLLLACYLRIMNIWTGQDDLIINMPVYNREHHFATARKVLGSFLDIFPVRIKIAGRESIISIARRCEKFIRALLQYPVSSIELTRLIAEKEGLKQGSLSNIIFSNSINMIPKGMVKTVSHLQLGDPIVHTGAPGTLIDLVLYSWEGKWRFDWNFVRNLLDETMVQTMAQQLQAMLRNMAMQSTAYSGIELYWGENLLPERFRQLYNNVNNTGRLYPTAPVHSRIAEQALITPDKTAITFEHSAITYQELDAAANRMAHLLTELGAGPDQFVVLVHNRSINLLVAQLAILKAGAAYVPIDPNYPAERIAYMMQDAGASIIITQSEFLELLSGMHINSITHCLVTDTVKKITAGLEGVQVLGPNSWAALPAAALPELCSPESLMYMIYTSGSTGAPKGVMIRHRNCANFLHYVQQAFNIRPQERIALVTSYSFDMTITSNWVPFITGASLHILSEEKARNTELLLRFLEEERITFLNVTPSHFSLLVNTLAFMPAAPVLEKEMTIMLGAEIINANDLNNWLAYYPGHRFINEYGPTEATVASTFFPIPVNEENKVVLKTVPIGKPIYNTQIYILDDKLEPCMPGVPGTLYIGGEGVAKGYLNKPDRTTAAFIVNPLTNNPTDVVYNTGDLAKFREDGNIIFLGRKDQQVNFKGYRIELGDIEAALTGFEGVAEACAAMQKDRNKQDILVAFYTSKNKEELSHREMAAHLAGKLPEHMVPLIYHRLKELPVNTNGKLDRRMLPEVGTGSGVAVRADYVAPVTETEIRFAKIWEEVLAVSSLGVHENFWEIGGDSIRSVRLIQQLRQAGYHNIRISDIFNSPTIATMSRLVEKRNLQTTAVPGTDIVTLKSAAGNGPRIFCLPYAAGNPGMYAEFCRYLPAQYEVFAAQYPGHGDTRTPLNSIPEFTAGYLDFLCSLPGPLFIVGYSFGGYIAYDVCRQLISRGRHPAGIIQVSTTPPGSKDALMELLSADDEALVAKAINRDIIEQNLLAGLTEQEQMEYIALLKTDTRAMLQYTFSDKPLPLKGIFITGDEEEDAIIRKDRSKWTGYLADCSFKTLPGGHLLIRGHAQQLAATVAGFVDQCMRTVHKAVIEEI